MKFLNLFLNYLKSFLKINLKLQKFILKLYFGSIFYRKKHIRNDNYKWLTKINLSLINDKEGKIKIGDLQFIIPINHYNTIPLHQRYLYAALISVYDIPKHFLLFWDALIVFNEIFLQDVYNKQFEIKEGDIIIDVGASIGGYTCKVSKKVGDKGKIIAIEPNPVNYQYLLKNIELNRLNNIIPLNLGVFSIKKELSLICKGYGSSVKSTKDIKFGSNAIKIDVDTLDNLLSGLKLEKINLIKMDIEGSEIEAIKGAKNIIKDHKTLKLVIAAYHKNKNGIESYRILIPYLEKKNFKIYKEYLPYLFASKIIEIN